jgi:cyclophilin family peptidyl-prolyl cis-trans isomerase
VVEGMDVVDRIEAIPTGRGGPFPRDVPRTTIVIEKITRVPAPDTAS